MVVKSHGGKRVITGEKVSKHMDYWWRGREINDQTWQVERKEELLNPQGLILDHIFSKDSQLLLLVPLLPRKI
jgi:hypothetical protein